MTVSNVKARVQYNGNGATTIFAYSFQILVDADLRVTVTSAVGVPTLLVLNDDYTVTGAGNPNGGTVVLSAGSLCPTESTLTLLSAMALTQETDYVDGQGFSAESVERALDKLTLKMQSVAVIAEDVGEAAGAAAGGTAGTAAGTISGAAAGAAAASPFADAAEQSAIAAEISNQNAYTSEINANAARDFAGGYANEAEDSAAAAANSAALALAATPFNPLAGTAEISIADIITKGPWVDVRSFMDGLSGRNTLAAWVADQTIDVTASISAADAYAFANGHPLVFEYGTYYANELKIKSNGTMRSTAKLVYNGAVNGVLFEIEALSASIRWGNLYLDGNAMDCCPLRISNDGNLIELVVTENVTATAAGNTNFAGMQVNGDSNVIGKVIAKDMVNDGHSNGSFPQSVTITGDKNSVGHIICKNGRAALVTGSLSGTTTVGKLETYDMLDNGIYQLGGILALDSLTYQGTEEPAVFQGSGSIGNITIIGACVGLGFDNIGEIHIEKIQLLPDASGNTAAFLFRTRSLNVAAGRLSIGKVSGTLKGTSLFSLAVGTFEYLEISAMNVRFLYDAAIATSLTAWADLTACAGFSIKNMRLEIVDINNVATGSTIFTMKAPTAVTKRSFATNFDIIIYNSDLVTPSAAAFRGTTFAQTLIETNGVCWRADIGPYLTANNGSLKDFVTVAPSAGTWVRGKKFIYLAPAASGKEGVVCVASGTPGTWKEYGSIVA